MQIYALWNNKVSTLKKTSLEVIGIAVLTIAATDCWVGCAQECHKDRWAINFLTTPPSEILGFFAPEAKHQQWVFLAFERYVNFSMATPARYSKCNFQSMIFIKDLGIQWWNRSSVAKKAKSNLCEQWKVSLIRLRYSEPLEISDTCDERDAKNG